MACTQEDAKPYKKYKVLYGERKFARDFVSVNQTTWPLNYPPAATALPFLNSSMCADSLHGQTKEKQSLSFSDDLPVEIRLQVYRLLFKIPGNFFELWAPSEWTKTCLWYRTDERLGWAKNNCRRIARQKQGLRMMRLCKKIREEVADYFYGGNNFRFSNEDGIVVMAAMFYTIRPFNCSFLRHITLQIPNRGGEYNDHTVKSNSGWNNLYGVLTRRGMRIPQFGFRAKHKAKGRSEGEFCYEKSVYRCFRQLRGMPNLTRLEITIPWDFKFVEEKVVPCIGPAENVEAMSPDDRIRHTVLDHSRDAEYWDLLADLKENTVSKDLTIALVIHYGFTSGLPEEKHRSRATTSDLCRARWVAAYAALMGYEMGYARWETEGPGRGSYQVRYDEDLMRAAIPEGQENSLLEPPQLTEHH